MTQTQDSQVNQPTHYNQGEVECIDALEAMCTPEEFIGFLRCNIVKYLWRANLKRNTQQDIDKADWYLQYLRTFCKKHTPTFNDELPPPPTKKP